MKILVAHNAYQQRGGEDIVAEAEAALLRRYGHDVIEHQRHNDEFADLGRAQASFESLWSRRTQRDLHKLLREKKPDIVHVHNTWPLISPSLYWAAAEAGVPTVQTLHNFRLLCPQGMLLREGAVCESCVGRAPWPGVVHACYRGSRVQSAVLAGMLVLHRKLGTWQHKVTRYIALNDFCRRKFVEGGLPAERIAVKPNFVDLETPSFTQSRHGLLFVGRLSPEKGVQVLADVAAALPSGSLRVAGSGPLEEVLRRAPGIALLGPLPASQVTQEMRGAIALVMPSIWYENFPRTLVEAWACGLPVVASRLGAMAELVEDGVTGLLVEPGNSAQWVERLGWALGHPKEMAAMGQSARDVYERNYTGATNYRMLMDIYSSVLAEPRTLGTGP